MAIVVVQTDLKYDSIEIQAVGRIYEWHRDYKTISENAVKAQFLDSIVFNLDSELISILEEKLAENAKEM